MKSDALNDIPFSRISSGSVFVWGNRECIKAYDEYYRRDGKPVNAFCVTNCSGIYVPMDDKVICYPDATIHHY